MKRLFIILGALALTSITLQAANCGPCTRIGCKTLDCGSPGYYDNCDRLFEYDEFEDCCFDLSKWYLTARGTVTSNEDLKFFSSFMKMSVNQKIGGGLSVALGYKINDCFRAEFEALYHRNSIQCLNFSNLSSLITEPAGDKNANGAVQDAAIMGNLYYDYPIFDCMKLYVGAGAGLTYNRIRISTIQLSTGKVPFEQFFSDLAATFPAQASALNSVCPAKSRTYFAWNLMGGASYALGKCWTLEVGYRLFAKNKIKFNHQLFEKVKLPITHAVVAGLRYNF